MWFGIRGKRGIRLLAQRAGVALMLMIVSAITVPAAAQEISDQALQQGNLGSQASGKWDISLGAGAGTAPACPGAKRERVVPVPFASITYDNLLFVGPLGLGFNAFRWASADAQYGVRAGPVIGYTGGRKESVDPHLAGLGDIQPSLTAGLFATVRAGPFEFAATARQAVTHRENGLIGLMSLNYHLPVMGKKLDVAIGPELTIANATYRNTWFGLSAEQSAQSGLPVFTPGSGVLLEPGLHASATYRYSEHVFVRGFAAAKAIDRRRCRQPDRAEQDATGDRPRRRLSFLAVEMIRRAREFRMGARSVGLTPRDWIVFGRELRGRFAARAYRQEGKQHWKKQIIPFIARQGRGPGVAQKGIMTGDKLTGLGRTW